MRKQIIQTLLTIIAISFYILMMFRVFAPLFMEIIEDYGSFKITDFLLWIGCVFSITIGAYYTLMDCLYGWVLIIKKEVKELRNECSKK